MKKNLLKKAMPVFVPTSKPGEYIDMNSFANDIKNSATFVDGWMALCTFAAIFILNKETHDLYRRIRELEAQKVLDDIKNEEKQNREE